MNFGLDAYTRNARLKPAFPVALPAAWTVMAWSPGNVMGWTGFWSLFVAGGGTWLLSQMARDRGKLKERALFERFGGRPTERLLSHAHAPNKVRLQQRHAKLAELQPGLSIPSAQDERRNPAAVRQVYEACVSYLITRTRDDRMVFQENMNYGFRSNLWGLKPIGIVVSSGSAVVLGLRLLSGVLHPRTGIAAPRGVRSVKRPDGDRVAGLVYAVVGDDSRDGLCRAAAR